MFRIVWREYMIDSYHLDEMTEVDGFRISLPDMESNVTACALWDTDGDGWGEFVLSLPD